MGEEPKSEEPECIETYLALERYLEQLHQNQRPARPRKMPPDQVSLYQMADLFHAASQIAEPEARFGLALWGQIEGLLLQSTVLRKNPV